MTFIEVKLQKHVVFTFFGTLSLIEAAWIVTISLIIGIYPNTFTIRIQTRWQTLPKTHAPPTAFSVPNRNVLYLRETKKRKEEEEKKKSI